jgi:hypothetical protein
MRWSQSNGVMKVALGGVLVLAAGRLAPANINLALQGVTEECATHTLGIDLYAISDSEESQSISAMDVILSWDAAVLQLTGVDSDGPYPYQWLFSGFTNDSGLDGLNNTWTDGNALYTAMAQLGGGPAWAPPDGLLVTRFLFRKLHVGDPTLVSILDSFGDYTHTVVYDGLIPGLDVTGTLTPVTVLPSATGDTNCSGAVGFDDINPFVQMLANPEQWIETHPDCNFYNGDINCDGTVDFQDINPFVALLSS